MDKIELLANITTILANVAVIASLIVALRQLLKARKANELSESSVELMRKTYLEEHTRNLRQSTIEFYNEINKETKDLIDDVILKKVNLDLNIILSDDDLHKRVRRYLSLMERFSVGINSKMYDLETFDRVQGKTTLLMYEALKQYIDSISEKYGSYFYGDFLNLVNQLEIRRKSRRDSGYSDITEKFSEFIM